MEFYKNRNFHIIFSSPWPLYIAAVVLMMLSELSKIMHLGNDIYYLVNFGYCVLFLGFLIFSWLEDISIESVQIQTHSDAVRTGLRIGMVLFIITEVMFFFSFFWAYFHAALSPSIYIGCPWSYEGAKAYCFFLMSTCFYVSYKTRCMCTLGLSLRRIIAIIFIMLLGEYIVETVSYALEQLFSYAQVTEKRAGTRTNIVRSGMPGTTEDLLLLTVGVTIMFILGVIIANTLKQ